MTRFGFFLFNILLVALIYFLVYVVNGANAAAIKYTLHNFSEPYVVVILIMTLFNTIRWFMHHDPDVGREVGTWVIALFFVPAITALALYLVGGLQGQVGVSLHTLMTTR